MHGKKQQQQQTERDRDKKCIEMMTTTTHKEFCACSSTVAMATLNSSPTTPTTTATSIAINKEDKYQKRMRHHLLSGHNESTPAHDSKAFIRFRTVANDLNKSSSSSWNNSCKVSSLSVTEESTMTKFPSDSQQEIHSFNSALCIVAKPVTVEITASETAAVQDSKKIIHSQAPKVNLQTNNSDKVEERIDAVVAPPVNNCHNKFSLLDCVCAGQIFVSSFADVILSSRDYNYHTQPITIVSTKFLYLLQDRNDNYCLLENIFIDLQLNIEPDRRATSKLLLKDCRQQSSSSSVPTPATSCHKNTPIDIKSSIGHLIGSSRNMIEWDPPLEDRSIIQSQGHYVGRQQQSSQQQQQQQQCCVKKTSHNRLCEEANLLYRRHDTLKHAATKPATHHYSPVSSTCRSHLVAIKQIPFWLPAQSNMVREDTTNMTTTCPLKEDAQNNYKRKFQERQFDLYDDDDDCCRCNYNLFFNGKNGNNSNRRRRFCWSSVLSNLLIASSLLTIILLVISSPLPTNTNQNNYISTKRSYFLQVAHAKELLRHNSGNKLTASTVEQVWDYYRDAAATHLQQNTGSGNKLKNANRIKRSSSSSSSHHSSGGGGGQQRQAPVIQQQPESMVAIEGETFELNCEADGNPRPEIEWYHNGQRLVRETASAGATRTIFGGSIFFLNFRAGGNHQTAAPSEQQQYINSNNQKHTVNNSNSDSDVGTYWCLAKNEHGQVRSQNATLQLAYLRSDFRQTPRNLQVSQGETATFECVAPYGTPEPRIHWKKNGQLIQPSASVSIMRLAKTIANNNNNKRNSIHQQQQQTLGNLVDVYGSELVLLNVQKSDEAKYSCVAETNGTHKSIVRESGSASLSVYVKPYFVEAPEHKLVYHGDQVNFKCKLGGDPEPVLSWRKQNGQPLPERSQIDVSDKTLVIDKVTSSDQGMYICEGENPVGTIRTFANLTVIFRPVFTALPQNLTLPQNTQHVQLRCSGEASPPPMLFWFKEGQRKLMFAPPPPAPLLTTSVQSTTSDLFKGPQLDSWSPIDQAQQQHQHNSRVLCDQGSSLQQRIYVDSLGTLNIYNLTSTDDGFYSCALISSIGSVLTRTKLSVIASTTFSHDMTSSSSSLDLIAGTVAMNDYQRSRAPSIARYELLPPPYIKIRSQSQTLPVNTNVKLLCDVVSLVPYKIIWFKDSVPIRDDSLRVIVYNTGLLSIDPLQTTDSGLYTCLVTTAWIGGDANGVGQAGSVRRQPDSIDEIMLEQSTNYTLRLIVDTPLNPNINFYRMQDITMMPSQPGIPKATTSSSLLLTPNTNGEYGGPTANNNSMRLFWDRPATDLINPMDNNVIEGYILEHYDSSKAPTSWQQVPPTVLSTSLAPVTSQGGAVIIAHEEHLFEYLNPNGSHYFVVRAVNKYGDGPSSQISGPWRTRLGELIYQKAYHSLDHQSIDSKAAAAQATPVLTAPAISNKSASVMAAPLQFKSDLDYARERMLLVVTNLINLLPISSTSVKLEWSMQRLDDQFNETTLASPLSPPTTTAWQGDIPIEGFCIRYRAVLSTPDHQAHQPDWWWATQTDSSAPISPTSNNANDTLYDDPNAAMFRWRRSAYPPTTSSFIDGPANGGGMCPEADFSEIKVVDPTISYYTINGLKQYTEYEFFVTPYYKTIDGVPSNILSAETNEGRPSVAPPNLTIRQLNETSVLLSWLGVPRSYANGIVRGYRLVVNSSDSTQQPAGLNKSREVAYQARSIDLPLNQLHLQLINVTVVNGNRDGSTSYGKQLMISYELGNLTQLTQLYSFKVTAYTIAGHGPYSDSINIILDSSLVHKNFHSTDNMMMFDNSQMLAESPIGGGGTSGARGGSKQTNTWLLALSSSIVVIILLFGYLLFTRKIARRVSNTNNHMSWKQMLSSQLSQKFYHQAGQQYSGSGNSSMHAPTEHTLVTQASHSGLPHMWQLPGAANNNGLLSSHQLALQTVVPTGAAGQQSIGANLTTDAASQLGKTSINHLVVNNSSNSRLNQKYKHETASEIYPQPLISGDYYSVVNVAGGGSSACAAEYEELDNGTMRTKTTTINTTTGNSRTSSQQQVEFNSPLSSNSTSTDTNSNSCPTSVTRLIPTSFNSNTISRKLTSFGKQQQQQQLQQVTLMSPYATTNLIMDQQQQQFGGGLLNHHQPAMDLISLQQQQQQFILHQQQLQQQGAVITGNQTYNQVAEPYPQQQQLPFMQHHNMMARHNVAADKLRMDQQDEQLRLNQKLVSITSNPMEVQQQQQQQQQDDNNFYEQIDYEQAFATTSDTNTNNLSRLVTSYNHHHQMQQHQRGASNASVGPSPSNTALSYTGSGVSRGDATQRLINRNQMQLVANNGDNGPLNSMKQFSMSDSNSNSSIKSLYQRFMQKSSLEDQQQQQQVQQTAGILASPTNGNSNRDLRLFNSTGDFQASHQQSASNNVQASSLAQASTTTNDFSQLTSGNNTQNAQISMMMDQDQHPRRNDSRRRSSKRQRNNN